MVAVLFACNGRASVAQSSAEGVPLVAAPHPTAVEALCAPQSERVDLQVQAGENQPWAFWVLRSQSPGRLHGFAGCCFRRYRSPCALPLAGPIDTRAKVRIISWVVAPAAPSPLLHSCRSCRVAGR